MKFWKIVNEAAEQAELLLYGEISNYTWDTDKFGTRLNVPIDDFNHLMDAMRYALERYITKPDWLI